MLGRETTVKIPEGYELVVTRESLDKFRSDVLPQFKARKSYNQTRLIIGSKNKQLSEADSWKPMLFPKYMKMKSFLREKDEKYKRKAAHLEAIKKAKEGVSPTNQPRNKSTAQFSKQITKRILSQPAHKNINKSVMVVRNATFSKHLANKSKGKQLSKYGLSHILHHSK